MVESLPTPPTRFAAWFLALPLIGLMALPAVAAPALQDVTPRGLQSGGTTTLTLTGSDLQPDTRLVVPFAVGSQKVLPGSNPQRLQLAVTLPAGVQPGFYGLRVAGAAGISNVVGISVDALPELGFDESVKPLPAALSGAVSGSAALQARFVGKKGQRIVAELEARRLGSGLDPFLELLDGRGVPLASSPGVPALEGDARVEAVLPADGEYRIQVRDILYQAAGGAFFRLKVGELHAADFAFPLACQRGTKPEVQLVGLVPPDTRATIDLSGARNDVAAPLPKLPGLIGPGPRLRVSSIPEQSEQPTPAGKLQEFDVPVGISGRIAKPGEEDRYRLRVKPGQRLRFRVLAERAGSPVDSVLTVRTEDGGVLKTDDDVAGTVDSEFDLAVPAGKTALIVSVSDLLRRGGPDHLYRVSVEEITPTFTLTSLEDRANLPRSGTEVWRVRAERAGYNGPITLRVEGLPAGIGVAGTEIPAGATDALLTLTASPEQSPWQGVVRVIGEGGGQERVALAPAAAFSTERPWLREELGLAVVAPRPLTVAWANEEPNLPLGYQYPAKVTLDRTGDVKGTVRLSLLTSQIVPRTKDGKQEDTSKAIRLQAPPVVPAGQNEGTAAVLVPGDLPAIGYYLVVQAELLGADGKQVVATAKTPARLVMPKPPLIVLLDGAPKVEARAGLGATGSLKGTVKRPTGFAGPVTVTLAGLPKELPAPSVLVPPEQGEYQLSVSFPFGTKAGDLPNVKLVARAGKPTQVLQSNEIPIGLKVVAGEPPPPPPALLRLFEDEPQFVEQLTEGTGQATLEPNDRYSGTASLRVTPDQRFRATMPGWGYRIREKPQPGEYRYLRFAWKRTGGPNVMVQLNVDNHWGPPGDKDGPAFRYEAGTDNSFGVKALKLGDKAPDQWTVVTRDLFQDFGACTLTGIALTPGPGGVALFDHLYLARTQDDLKQCPAPTVAKPK